MFYFFSFKREPHHTFGMHRPLQIVIIANPGRNFLYISLISWRGRTSLIFVKQPLVMQTTSVYDADFIELCMLFLLSDIIFIIEALYIKATDINIYCEKLYKTYVRELDG